MLLHWGRCWTRERLCLCDLRGDRPLFMIYEDQVLLAPPGLCERVATTYLVSLATLIISSHRSRGLRLRLNRFSRKGRSPTRRGANRRLLRIAGRRLLHGLTGHPHILGWLLLTVLIIVALGRGLGFATCDPYTFHARRHLINRVPRGILLLSLGLRHGRA